MIACGVTQCTYTRSGLNFKLDNNEIYTLEKLNERNKKTKIFSPN